MELFKQAEALREAGAHEEAVAMFLKSFELDEINWPAPNNAASILFNKQHKPAEAQPLFEKAFELSHSIQIARNLELCRQALNRIAQKRR